MSDSALPLLVAVEAKLKTNSIIQQLASGRVYGAAPPNPDYPFVVISCDSQPFMADDVTGMDHRLRVQAFAREKKPATVLALRAAAYAELNRQEVAIDLPDHNLIVLEHEGLATAFPEGDGRTYQSVIEFKALIQ